MAIPMEITELGIDVKDYVQRTLRQAHRVGMRAAADKWRRDFLPRHFEGYAPARYRYDRRSRRYVQRKERKGRGPLVWSGTLRRSMLHGTVQIRTTASGIRMKFIGLPSYIVNGGGLLDADKDAAVQRLQNALARADSDGERRRIQGRLNRLVSARSVARYPNIRRELVVVDDGEAKALVTAYREGASEYLATAPTRKRRRKVTT